MIEEFKKNNYVPPSPEELNGSGPENASKRYDFLMRFTGYKGSVTYHPGANDEKIFSLDISFVTRTPTGWIIMGDRNPPRNIDVSPNHKIIATGPLSFEIHETKNIYNKAKRSGDFVDTLKAKVEFLP